MTPPVDVFVSYAPADEGLWRELEKHLSSLERAGVIRAWGGHKIGAGENWRSVVDARFESARVIVMLLSADFFASNHCYDVEFEKALAMADKGTARVIPVRVRPYDWGVVPSHRLRVLPANGQPVMSWPNPEDAWVEVAREIRLAISAPLQEVRTDHDADASKEILFRNWNPGAATNRVLGQLRDFGGLREYGFGHPSSDAHGVSHEVHDFFYLKYIDHAAYVAVAVTRSDPPDNCHASAPVLSFIEFIETPNGWHLGTVHVNALRAGAWGNPPSTISAMDIGHNMFAIVIEDGFMNQGYIATHTSVHTAVTGEFKEVFATDTGGDDGGTGRSQEDSWSTEIKVVREGTSFYDLIVHRSGMRGGKALNERLIYKFDGREYAQASLYR